jgi:hypothetical protein
VILIGDDLWMCQEAFETRHTREHVNEGLTMLIPEGAKGHIGRLEGHYITKCSSVN